MRAIILLILILSLTACAQQLDVAQKELPIIQEVSEMKLKISSPAFSNNASIPAKYACDRENVNPALNIEGIPPGTKSLALIVDDPDAPSGVWVHWVVWNIAPGNIEENSVPGEQGLNDFKVRNYKGPCPPSGTHRYYFKVYALDTTLSLSSSTAKKDLENAMKGHILSQGELMGNYSRS